MNNENWTVEARVSLTPDAYAGEIFTHLCYKGESVKTLNVGDTSKEDRYFAEILNAYDFRSRVLDEVARRKALVSPEVEGGK